MNKHICNRRRKSKPALKPYSEGDYKWAVYYCGEGGARARRKFTDKKSAADFFADKQVEVENLGNQIASVLGDEIKRDTYEALAILKPFGKSILDAANHYRAHLEATIKSGRICDLVGQFQDSKEADGKSHRYLCDLRNRLSSFVSTHGNRYASEISSKDLHEWLAEIRVSNPTRNNYRRVLSAFFGWSWRLGYCSENPVAKVTRAKLKPGTIEVYSPDEMRKMLFAAATWKPDRIKIAGRRGRNLRIISEHETTDVLANIVLCGFAGLRQSEFERLSWEQIKVDRGVIDLSAAITKTAARRLVKICPSLLAWLQHMGPFRSGRICKTNFSNRVAAFRRQLDTPWKHNALRHSFASYLMEETQSPGEVSLQLGHSDAGVVFAHYRELVAATDATDFWALTPEKTLKENADITPFRLNAVAS